MKIMIETTVLAQLSVIYGEKADGILCSAIREIETELPNFHPNNFKVIGYEDVVRRTKIRQRKSVLENENARDILNYLNKVADKSFRPVDATLKMITSLLKGYEKEDFIKVIDNKTSQWKGDFEMDKYLRPSTLFQKTNFDEYLNEAPSAAVVEKGFANKLDALLEQK